MLLGFFCFYKTSVETFLAVILKRTGLLVAYAQWKWGVPMKRKDVRTRLRWRQIARWIAVYLLVVLLIVAVVGIISVVAINAITQSARGEQREKMLHARASVDAVLEDTENALLLLSNDDYLVALSDKQLPYTPSQLYMLYDFNRAFGQHMLAHSTWDCLYAYFGKGDFVLEGGAKRTLADVHGMLDYALTQEEWVRLMESTGEPVYRCLASAKDPDRYYVEYWYPMIGHSREEPLGAIVVRLDDRVLTERMAALKWYRDEYVLAVDGEGRIVLSSDAATEETARILDTLAPALLSGETSAGLNGRFSVGVAPSEVNDWCYVSILPDDFLIANSHYNARIAQALCLMVLVVGVLLSVAAALLRFRPLGRLYELAEMAGDEPPHEEKNAYSYLEKSMTSMLEKNREAQRRLCRQNQLVRNDLLIRLITGNLRSVAALEDILFSNGISFVSERFIVLVLGFENEQELFFGESDGGETEQMARFITGNVFEELFAQTYNAFFFEYAGLNVGLINLNAQQNGESTLEVRALYEQGRQVIREHFGLQVTCAQSGLHTGYAGIAQAYGQALEVLEYQQLVGRSPDGFVCYEDVAQEEVRGSGAFSVDAQIRFMQSVKAGNLDQAREIMSREIEDARKRAPFDLERSRCFMFAVMNALLEAVDEIGENVGEDFFERIRPTERLLRCNSIANMRQQMEAILSEASEYIRRKRKDHGDQVVQQVMDHVHLRYMDVNINVSSIADEMGMSISGLSRLFKKKTGQGLLDYIVQVRMEAAKRLLADTGCTLTEIAEQVGLINANTLIRTFKRYTGQTPGKYKQENRKKQKVEEQ